jgi:hypothetical protein
MARGAARRPSGLQLSPTLSRHETRCSFRAIIASGQEPLVLPAAARILNAYAERWVRSMKEGCLSKVVLFGERSLRLALSEYVEHFHAERNLQTEAMSRFPSRDGHFVRANESFESQARAGSPLQPVSVYLIGT